MFALLNFFLNFNNNYYYYFIGFFSVRVFICGVDGGQRHLSMCIGHLILLFMAPANSHPQLLRDMFMNLSYESLDLKVCCWEWLAGGGCKDRTHGLSFSYYKPGQTLLHSLQWISQVSFNGPKSVWSFSYIGCHGVLCSVTGDQNTSSCQPVGKVMFSSFVYFLFLLVADSPGEFPF